MHAQAFSAGVGNWVADKVLYKAKLDPEVKAKSLLDKQIEKLYKALWSVFTVLFRHQVPVQV